MAFDLSTAKSEQSGGFDLSSAKPFETEAPVSTEGIPSGRSPGGFVSNVVKSGVGMLKGLGEAIAHPLDTATTVLDIGAGALQHALPKGVVDFVNQYTDPVAAKRAADVASAVGGMYAERYGSPDKIIKTLYEDPIGAAGDLSMLFSGGAGALNVAKAAPAATVAAGIRGGRAAQIAEKVAPVAGAIGRAAEATSAARIPVINIPISNFLEGGAKYTNVLAPVNWLAAKGIEYGAPAAAAVIGKAGEGIRGELPQQKAAKIVREAAGDRAAEIQQAARMAPEDLTAAQAIVEATANRPQMQAIAESVASQFPEKFGPIAERQKLARAEALKSVTPDEAAATLARDEVSGLTYDRAKAADEMRRQIAAEEVAAGRSTAGATGYTPPSQITPELEALKSNPAIQAAAKEAKKLAATKGIKLDDPMSTLEGLHYMKLALDAQFKSPQAATALQKFSSEALQGTKQQLLAAIEGTANAPGVSPLYGVARKQFAEMSKPINQAQVLNALSETLSGPAGKERAVPFLNALAKGEDSILKKATGFDRYESLEKVLTPEQMGTVNQVAGELTRDLTIAEQAKLGRTAANEILRKNAAKLLSPEFIDAKVTMFNKVAGFLQGRISDKALTALGEAFESGKKLDDLMKTVPLKERNAVLKAISNAQFELTPAQVRALGLGSNIMNSIKNQPVIPNIEITGSSNALSPQQNQNALVQ